MGYRLEISEVKYKACGGKLFGYCDEEKLKSYKYLLDKGYLDGDEYFTYGFSGDIVLNSDEFKEFIELYNEDCNKQNRLNGSEKDLIINDKKIKELLESEEDKLIQWW